MRQGSGNKRPRDAERQLFRLKRIGPLRPEQDSRRFPQGEMGATHMKSVKLRDLSCS